MDDLLKKLEGGDRRSVGRVDEVVDDVLKDPKRFDVLLEGMLHHDRLIRMRAADAVEKVTVDHPNWLQPYKKRLLEEVAKSDQQEVRWHVAQLFSRLDLTKEERKAAVAILDGYLDDKSKIVKTFVMQALADIAGADEDLRPTIVARLEELTQTGSPAMQSRGRKLLAKLHKL